MRIWSLHPKYLDRQGLLGCWRETLLAQNVLEGRTKGYKNHPQLIRFSSSPACLSLIASYLLEIAKEGRERGYHFDLSKIKNFPSTKKLPVTIGQVSYEMKLLQQKLIQRNPTWYERLVKIKVPEIHPLFYLVEGNVESWEKQKDLSSIHEY